MAINLIFTDDTDEMSYELTAFNNTKNRLFISIENPSDRNFGGFITLSKQESIEFVNYLQEQINNLV